jgi:transposase
MAGNCSAEAKVKAVRLVREQAGDYASEWAAISSVASRLQIGSAETLRTFHARRAGSPSRRALRDAWLTRLLAAIRVGRRDSRVIHPHVNAPKPPIASIR